MPVTSYGKKVLYNTVGFFFPLPEFLSFQSNIKENKQFPFLGFFSVYFVYFFSSLEYKWKILEGGKRKKKKGKKSVQPLTVQ